VVFLKSKQDREVLEKRILDSEIWKRGYAAFSALLKKPLGWMFLTTDARETLVRIDRKTNCSFYCKTAANQRHCEAYLEDKVHEQLKRSTRKVRDFECHAGRRVATFPMRLFNNSDGLFVTCDIGQRVANKTGSALGTAFHEFVQSQTELVHKNYELQNFYETVHPRALALSTMHSVHRVVSSSFSLDELLPKIGRLSMQILKVKDCAIWLVDEQQRYLIPQFSTQEASKVPSRRKMGSGLEGKVALMGEIYFSRKTLAMPFVDHEVLGVVILKNKRDGKPFTLTDLEIFKILSEQTVVAIKNAKLYDEMQQITLGSIKSINDLLELDFAGDNVHLPLFSKLVRAVGSEVGLLKSELTNLEQAVLLLDNGEVGLPDHILNKKTALTHEEYEEVKKQPSRAVSVLKSIRSLKPVIPIILHHHERFDGKGYPQGLAGSEIPIGARIVAVVDSFTAMISKRPYRQSKKVKEALHEVENHAGTQFDPKIVNAFLKVVRRAGLTK